MVKLRWAQLAGNRSFIATSLMMAYKRSAKMDFHYCNIEGPRGITTKQNKYKIGTLNVASLGNKTEEIVDFIDERQISKLRLLDIDAKKTLAAMCTTGIC